MIRKFLKLTPLSLLVVIVSCADHYKKGFNEGKEIGYTQGYDVGYDEGHTEGDADGLERGRIYFESAGYNEGFADGRAQGLSVGYNQGYTVGRNETYQGAYNNGYNVGYANGDADGYNRGINEGYDDGFDDNYDRVFGQGYAVGYGDGYDDGIDDRYDLGYNNGFSDGYDVGYDDGWYDAGGLSVGRSKKLRGFANLISLAHNDVFDYSKIPAPVVTRRGLVAGGRLLHSEISLTNKDTLKRAAAIEQYLVFEMAHQVKGKFNLSGERSLKIAKAANHFRKQSSKRSLTSEDTQAYALEIIGSDFDQIGRAADETLKGDVLAFNSVLERAAQKNDTSPENISKILATYFW